MITFKRTLFVCLLLPFADAGEKANLNEQRNLRGHRELNNGSVGPHEDPPCARFTPWSQLTMQQTVVGMDLLKYDEIKWNCFNPNYEIIDWNQIDAVTKALWIIVFDFDTEGGQYDCWINHYALHDWSGLAQEGVVTFWEALGWVQEMWDNKTGEPASSNKQWCDDGVVNAANCLSQDEVNAATALCFTQSTWNKDACLDDSSFSFPAGCVSTTSGSAESVATSSPPSVMSSPQPSAIPSESSPPSVMSSPQPSAMPSESSPPSSMPSQSSAPSKMASSPPSVMSSPQPSAMPSESSPPSVMPSPQPSVMPSESSPPSVMPSPHPSRSPSLEPSSTPSFHPSTMPSSRPSTTTTTTTTTTPLIEKITVASTTTSTTTTTTTTPITEVITAEPFEEAPCRRFTPWSQLSGTERSKGEELFGYNEHIWNCFDYSEEEVDWSVLSFDQIDVFVELFDFDEDGGQCDCWLSHYKNYRWSELKDEEVVGYWEALGWTVSMWDNGNGVPDSVEKAWCDPGVVDLDACLSLEEKNAATSLCYTQSTWNKDDGICLGDDAFKLPADCD